MPQLTLYAPAIHCEHCIATIQKAVEAQPGARFVDGDIEGRRFSVDLERGSILDALAEALAAEGYPLGDAESVARPAAAALTLELSGTHPAYRVTPADFGAELNYDCPCGCVAGFAFDRSKADPAPESCCCGRTMLVGARAEERLRAALEASNYFFDVQTVTMPWGQQLESALATPREPSH